MGYGTQNVNGLMKSLFGSDTPTVRAPGGPVDEIEDDDDDDEPAAPARNINGINDLQWNGIYVKGSDRWAPSSVKEILSAYQSCRARCQQVRCKDIRNKHEIDTLAVIVDAAIAGRSDIILEIAIRRIHGIEDADASGGRDWDLATSVDLIRAGQLGTEELRRRARKDAVLLKSSRPKKTGAATTGGGGGQGKKKSNRGGSGGRGGGRGNTTATQ
jgi:hypothetical protein